MSVPALDAATVEIEPKIPGGGGPGNTGPDDHGWGGGGDPEDDDSAKRDSLYHFALYLLIVSVTALFAGLVAAFWFRSRVTFLWQDVEAPRALWMSTGVLAASSVMMELARLSLRRQEWAAYRRRLFLTVLFGLGFVACQAVSVTQLAAQGFYFRGNPHASVFYIFTGAHAIHLLGGMVALNLLLFKRGRGYRQHRLFASLTAIYWHFMGVLWLALFALLLAW